MSTKETIAALKEKAVKRFERELDVLLGELEAAMLQQVTAEHLAVISDTLLTSRKQYAVTEEVALERGVTIDDLKLHNAEVAGWNKRGKSLRKKLLGSDDEAEPVPTPAPVVEVVVEPAVPIEPVVEPEPVPEPAPEPQV